MPSTTHASGGRIVAERLTYAPPNAHALFHDLTLSFGRERTGLVGANGSGKTTLVRLLTGEITPSSGSVHRNGVVAVLPQDFRPPAGAHLSAILGIEDRLAALRRMEAGAATLADVELIGNDWDVGERALAVLTRFGLGHLPLDRPLQDVSGGEATRVALAGLALGDHDFLLLDEPTNHLDAHSREALYAFVEGWTGGLLCVSHDRALLRRMDRIVELSALGVRIYGGNYDAYRARREADDLAAGRKLESARAALAVAEREACEIRERQARRHAQGKRDRATANMPKILLNKRKAQAQATTARISAVTEREIEERRARAKEARLRVEEREAPRFDLASTKLASGKTVLQLEEVSYTFPGAGATLLEKVSLRIVGPERVALVGPNGSGKSTLLKLVMGELQPSAGTITRAPDGETAFLDQQGAKLDPAASVLQNFHTFHPGLDLSASRYALARLLFSADAALQTVGTLSGGERLRASLACTMGGERPPSLLVLDEPSNHLDFEALGALESALSAYDGALLVVSHDSDFLEAIGIERTVQLGVALRR